jgi:hypothetical protein
LRNERSTSNNPVDTGSSGSVSRRSAITVIRAASSSSALLIEDSSAWSLLTATHLPASGPKRGPGSLARVSGPLTTLDLRGTDTSDPHALRTTLPRPKAAEEPPIEQVREVIEQVRIDGDAALRDLTKRFDGVDIDDVRVDPAVVAAAPDRITPRLRAALETAHANIHAYHSAQLHDPARYERDGMVVRELRRPVDRAGL